MDLGLAILALTLLALVARFVGAPLFASAAGEPRRGRTASAEALEAAREAKYREIRDPELDFRTGKLSTDDYEAIDAQLRSEAIEILNRLEALRRDGAEGAGSRTGRAEARRPERGPRGRSGPGTLEQHDRVHEEQDREQDRPAVEVALDHRPSAQRAGAGAHAERAGEARVLARVHQDQEHHDHRDGDLDDGVDCFHGPLS